MAGGCGISLKDRAIYEKAFNDPYSKIEVVNVDMCANF